LSIAEVLIQGHTDDVYAIDFHPKKPYKFATACDSSNVFLWNAKRRQLMAKVSIGVAARAVCFSPNGAHLAVGTNTGIVKVLLVSHLLPF
jgi:WD40 repeat protein